MPHACICQAATCNKANIRAHFRPVRAFCIPNSLMILVCIGDILTTFVPGEYMTV